MRSFIKITTFFCILTLLFSCKCSNNTTEAELDNVQAIVPKFDAQDSMVVSALATQYLDYLKNKQVDSALAMLSSFRNDSVLTLLDADRKDLLKQYAQFPVLSYQIGSIVFIDNNKSELHYCVEFFERKPGQEDYPNTMNFRLNPQKIDGVWHLGVLNK